LARKWGPGTKHHIGKEGFEKGEIDLTRRKNKPAARPKASRWGKQPGRGV